MAEYIDRILLGEAVSHGMVHYEDIMSMPTADVVERKHGKWTLFENDIEQNAYECSVCKDVFVLLEGTPQDNVYNFCPNCGADLRESEGEDGKET